MAPQEIIRLFDIIDRWLQKLVLTPHDDIFSWKTRFLLHTVRINRKSRRLSYKTERKCWSNGDKAHSVPLDLVARPLQNISIWDSSAFFSSSFCFQCLDKYNKSSGLSSHLTLFLTLTLLMSKVFQPVVLSKKSIDKLARRLIFDKEIFSL